MDLQTYLQNSVQAMRADTMSNSNQLTLGELILKLEPIVKKGYKLSGGEDPSVVYDFAYMQPTFFMSWRGSYSELAIGYENYGRCGTASGPKKLTDFYNQCKECIGKTFEGYKGGEFTMHKGTPIWVANDGEGCHTGVVDVIDNDYEVILVTQLCNF